MSTVNWLLSLLPATMLDIVALLLLVGGLIAYVVSYLVSWVPFIATYRLGLQILGVIAMVAGAYVGGTYHAEQRWADRVERLETRIREAETASNSANTVIQERVVTRIQRVEEIRYVNRDIIREVVGPQIDSMCVLPESSVLLHDSAARNEVAGSARNTDANPSAVAPSQLLETVVDNYAACHENAEKLKAWQEWYRRQKEIFEKIFR